MNNEIRKYQPSTNKVTVCLLTVTMLGFGLLAPTTPDTQTTNSVQQIATCDRLLPDWCQQFTSVRDRAAKKIFLI